MLLQAGSKSLFWQCDECQRQTVKHYQQHGSMVFAAVVRNEAKCFSQVRVQVCVAAGHPQELAVCPI